ncbi:MAG: zinc-binding alcohol dehydrogenase family protein [Acidimicrobiia bacterium]
MTRQVLATAYGGPEVLTLVEETLAPPAPNQAAIEVRAAGVNPADVKMYTGAFGTDPTRLPLRLGFEAAGVVTEAGSDSGVTVGDEVIAFPVSGAYADRMVVAGSALVPKPDGMDWGEAAGLMLTGTTAFHALTATDVKTGDTVLVHGAAGGVGLMAVQLAAVRGARVIGTASTRNHDQLRRLGAEPISYGEGLSERVQALAPDGIDAAIDLVGTDEAVDVSLTLVADRHRIASIAAFGRGGEVGIKLLGSGPGADPGTEVRNAARFELVRLVTEGRLRVFVAERYPLDSVAEAHRQILTGHTTGKIVLEP